MKLTFSLTSGEQFISSMRYVPSGLRARRIALRSATGCAESCTTSKVVMKSNFGAADEERRRLVGEHDRVLGGAPGLAVVGDVARGRHRVQPLAEVARVQPGLRRELFDGDWSGGGQRFEQIEPIADEAEGAERRRADVVDGVPEEAPHLLVVQRPRFARQHSYSSDVKLQP